MCSIPVDNEAPCPPTLSNAPNCPLLTDTLSWLITVNDSCANDIASFQLYHAPTGSSTFELVSTMAAGTNVYDYTNTSSIAGCYYITATDSAGNISATSNIVCAETCPDYVLPNVFTPDGNGINDTYHPFLPYRDIKDVDMKIFNRWGGLVFSTTDPMIRWNGKRNNTGEDNPEGTYFYICQVNEYYMNGIKPLMLKGTILLNRSENAK